MSSIQHRAWHLAAAFKSPVGGRRACASFVGKRPEYSSSGHYLAGASWSLLGYFALIMSNPSGALSHLFLEVRVTCLSTKREQLAPEQSLTASSLCPLALGPGRGVTESWA